jgi:hypothetical protein
LDSSAGILWALVKRAEISLPDKTQISEKGCADAIKRPRSIYPIAGYRGGAHGGA